MAKFITRPIGSKFRCNGVELEVVENTRGAEGYCGRLDCRCYFDDFCGTSEDSLLCRGTCSNFSRADGKDVYFKEVES